MHLYLIGYRGSGKSTVGRILAEHLGRPWIDLDEAIGRSSGLSIREIFETQGEDAFRRLESQELMKLAGLPPAVIALGGGTCESPANRMWLKQSGKCIWLRAEAGTLKQRIAADPQSEAARPALTGAGRLAEVDAVLERRHSNYAACADFTLDVDRSTPRSIAEQIVSWLGFADK